MEMLAALRMERRLYIVSGTLEDELQRIVARRGMTAYFDGVYGSLRLKEEIEQARRAVASRRHHLAKDATFRQHNTTRNDRLQGASFLRSCVCYMLPRSSRVARSRDTFLGAAQTPLHSEAAPLPSAQRSLPLQNSAACTKTFFVRPASTAERSERTLV